MSRLYERLIDGLAYASAIAIALLAIIISYSVVLRQVFGSVPPWVSDVTSFTLVAVTFAGGAYVLERDGHTRIDILIGSLSGRPRRVLEVLSAILGFIAVAVLAGAAFYAVIDNYERGAHVVRAIQVQKWIVLSPIAIGSVLIAIKFLQVARRKWRGEREGETPKVSL